MPRPGAARRRSPWSPSDPPDLVVLDLTPARHRRHRDPPAPPHRSPTCRSRADRARLAPRQGHRARIRRRRLRGQALRARGAASRGRGRTSAGRRSIERRSRRSCGPATLEIDLARQPRDLAAASVVQLTPTELRLLEVLLAHRGKLVTPRAAARSGLGLAPPERSWPRARLHAPPPPQAPRRRGATAADLHRARSRLPLDRRRRGRLDD